jgi:hypothetical protein
MCSSLFGGRGLSNIFIGGNFIRCSLCVSYKIDGIPELIKNEEYGFLCKPNIYQMSESIIKLLTKNNLHISMSQKSMS